MEKKEKKLCVFTLYADKGGSSQYRSYLFKETLENNFDVKWYYFWNNQYATKYMHNKKKYFLVIALQYIIAIVKRWYQLQFIASKCDVIFIQKASIPKLKKTFLKKIKKKHIRIIFDVDDAVYLDKKDNSNEIACFADVVICGNETLKKHYEKYCKKIIVFPTIENTEKYMKYWSSNFTSKSIVWIGSKTTVKNIELVVNPINKVINRHPEVKLYIISNDALDFPNRIKNCSLIKWEKEKYIKDLSNKSIGIMPLYDTEYNRGKCGFKLVQYLNMKLPVIGSPVGVNTQIIEGNGLLASTEEEWEKSFEKLLFNEEFYNDCVKHIEDDFLRKYSYATISNKLIDVLNGR
ncbi:MAG: hypothetical protein DBY41_08085 [Clostridium sp.]|nr:MAG: hypothetical protein DBY41_08085 [Clostridium sp.]